MTRTLERRSGEVDPGLASQLRLSIRRLSRRLAIERDPRESLPVNAVAVLGLLHRRGEVALSELSAHERVQPPTMTRIVRCLEDADCVVRRPSPSDGRVTLVSLSPRGRDRLLHHRQLGDAWLSQRLAELAPEERDLLSHAAELLEALSHRD